MAIAGSGWPRYVVLKSDDNYRFLQYIDDGPLQFSGDDLTSRSCRFELEMAQTENEEGWFNIKSCYNGKYLSTGDDGLVKAAAAEPDEDASQRSCTLFQPFYPKDDIILVGITFRFDGATAGLTTKSDDPDKRPLFGVGGDVSPAHWLIDWGTRVVFPKHFALKGSNGKYLGPVAGASNELQFVYDDIGNPAVAFEAYDDWMEKNVIKSASLDSEWFSDEDDPPRYYAGLSPNHYDLGRFEAIKVSGNTIALRSYVHGKICGPYNNCLSACMTSIPKEAILTVAELVLQRKIYNVRFDLARARIYNETVLSMGTTDATNGTTNPEDVTLSVKYTKSTTRTWNSSVSLTLGVSATVEGGIPSIFEGKVTVSASVTGSYSWGETYEESLEDSADYTITVDPKTVEAVRYVATQGTCEVPFSYTQRDLLHTGDWVEDDKDDGVFTGINCYNFHFEHSPEGPVTSI